MMDRRRLSMPSKERDMISAELVRTVLGQFALASDGEHGVAHWARVLENGLCLATLTAADPTIIALFAVLHDARRLTDDLDPMHGLRAATYAASLRDAYFTLSDADFERLSIACAYHADGLTAGD